MSRQESAGGDRPAGKARARESGITLARDGKPLARIVVAPGAAEVEKHAAGELRKYLLQISGAELPIGNAAGEEGTNIYLGAAAKGQGLDVSEEALGFDGYVVRTNGRDVVLAGAKPYSCLYAAYHLLERHLGCGFFEDGDQTPGAATVRVGEIDDVCKPRFSWRVYVTVMEYAYSGMRWWDWDQFRAWVDWMVKKRFNLWYPCRLHSYTGIGAIAAGKLGVPIALTEYQRQRQELMRRVFAYARERGIRTLHDVSDIYSQSNQKLPGTYSFPDRLQMEEFVRRYQEQTGQAVPVLSYEWCGTRLPVLDPRSPVTGKFVAAAVEAYAEALGTDHLYILSLPSEGGWESADTEEMNRVTYSMLMDLVSAVRAGDPQAEIFTQPPFRYNRTFEAQKRAVQDARLPVLSIGLEPFQVFDYYWGLPWLTGLTLTCGKHTNPHGDLAAAVHTARNVAADPQAANCRGFTVASEVNHRMLILNELFAELSWDPAVVEVEGFLRRWNSRRYGPEAAPALWEATRAVAGSLYSHPNMDATNHPLFRDFHGGYLVGLTPTSVRRTLSYLPAMRGALEAMVSASEPLGESPLFRFDLVDLGRTYLGALFNDRLAKARKALRSGDRVSFESAAAGVEEVMHFMARFCSADPGFRLATHDEWARRWPQVLPGYANEESNWITFTALISRETWMLLLDYAAEDFAEMIEHYYWPRVRLYLQQIRERLEAGQGISGRLVYRNTETELLFRVGDYAPPGGTLPWSPYGATCEPELTAGDLDVVCGIMDAGSVSGRFDFHEGPLAPLGRELLDRFPIPDDLEQTLAEPEPTTVLERDVFSAAKPGDRVPGLCIPGEVEKIVIPPEARYLVDVKEIGREYNLLRGDVTRYKVKVSDFVELTRLPDERAPVGEQRVTVFQFAIQGRPYRLRFDPGSEAACAGLYIDPCLR